MARGLSISFTNGLLLLAAPMERLIEQCFWLWPISLLDLRKRGYAQSPSDRFDQLSEVPDV